MALGSMVVAGCVAFARGILGLGHGGRGWGDISTHINDEEILKTHPVWKPDWKGSTVQSHRRFGRTGWSVSDIVLGTGRIRDEDGENRGAHGHRPGRELHRHISRLLRHRERAGDRPRDPGARRDQLFVATKFCTSIGHLGSGTPVAKYKEAVEASLGRLGTDYVDLCHIHSCDSV